MATRDDLLSAPRSGARPLFRGEPAAPRSEASGTSRESSGGSSSPGGSGGSQSVEAKHRAEAERSGLPAVPPRSSSGSAESTAPRQRRGSRLRTAQGIGRAATSTPDFKNYQGIILVEFILAELLVAGTPIVARKPARDTSLSPYIPRDMTKLLSLGLLYFLLELMAVGGAKAGRLGAWFGGLILLAVGLNEGANVAKTLDLFGGGASQPSQSPLQSDVQSGQIGVT